MKYVVTTATDSINDSDGALSLREAVALANAAGGPSEIAFDPSLSIVELSDGALSVAAGTTVVIDGDHNGDGIADVSIRAGTHHHFTNNFGADLTLQGLVLFDGQGEFESFANGARGDQGA